MLVSYSQQNENKNKLQKYFLLIWERLKSNHNQKIFDYNTLLLIYRHMAFNWFAIPKKQIYFRDADIELKEKVKEAIVTRLQNWYFKKDEQQWSIWWTIQAVFANEQLHWDEALTSLFRDIVSNKQKEETNVEKIEAKYMSRYKMRFA